MYVHAATIVFSPGPSSLAGRSGQRATGHEAPGEPASPHVAPSQPKPSNDVSSEQPMATSAAAPRRARVARVQPIAVIPSLFWYLRDVMTAERDSASMPTQVEQRDEAAAGSIFA